MIESQSNEMYRVVINDEEQYSIWPTDRVNAPGWRDEGAHGTKEQCLAHIARVWTDMRPLSLRKAMEHAGVVASTPSPENAVSGQTLVDRLCIGEHTIIARVYPEASVSALHEAVERGYIHIAFVDTLGPAEIGIRLASTHRPPDEGGPLQLIGDFVLDFVSMRCQVHLAPGELTGVARVWRHV